MVTENKLGKSVLECVAILLCTVLVCSFLFSSPVFAVDSFSGQPFNSSSSIYIGVRIAGVTDGGKSITFSDFSEDTYLYFVPSGQYYELRVVHLDSSPVTVTRTVGDSSSSVSFGGSFDSNTMLYHTYDGYAFQSINESIPVFSNYSVGLVAVRDYIDNGGSSDTVYDFETTVSVEPGTVLYIGVPANGTLSMSGTTRFPFRSNILNGTFPNASQRVSRASSLPSAGTTFPLSPASMPNWQKVAPFNVLGQSFDAEFSTSTWSFDSTGFLTFYNPYYSNVEDFNDAGGLNTNSTVYLIVSGYSSLRSYPLQDGVLNSTSPDDFTVYSDAVITDNGDGTGSVTGWSNQNGDTSVSPPSNNNYNGGSAASNESILMGIKNTLDNFVNSFVQFISAPISHINNLISAGSGFMSALRGLYAWLPVDVQGILISALTVIISIGVFKVFL